MGGPFAVVWLVCRGGVGRCWCRRDGLRLRPATPALRRPVTGREGVQPRPRWLVGRPITRPVPAGLPSPAVSRPSPRRGPDALHLLLRGKLPMTSHHSPRQRRRSFLPRLEPLEGRCVPACTITPRREPPSPLRAITTPTPSSSTTTGPAPSR